MTDFKIYICDKCKKRIIDFKDDLFTIKFEREDFNVCKICFNEIKEFAKLETSSPDEFDVIYNSKNKEEYNVDFCGDGQ